MKKALIIGAAGFVGHYLTECIQQNRNWQVCVTKLPQELVAIEGVEIYDLDILNQEAVCSLLERLSPDYIFHLAAQSSVAYSWKNPEFTLDVNICGTLHVLEAARQLRKKPRILLIGSGEEYGHVKEADIPITEDTLPKPGNIYAATKVCQNMLGRIYAEAYGLEIINVRAFNHIGPNQASIFVTADFCNQVAEIEKGLKRPVIQVGNLEARRDFTDVRDVVWAYVLLIEKGTPGETYNVGSGQAVSIHEILDQILKMSSAEIEVTINPEKFRTVDIPVIEADIKKLRECTGWEPKLPLEKTIYETLEYWRKMK